MTETATPRFTTAHVLATVAAIFVPMAILLAKGVAPLFALAVVGVAALALVRRRRLPLLTGPIAYFLAAMAAWALLTWFWSIAPNDTIKTGISLALTFLGGAVLIGCAARLDQRERRIFDTGLIVGGAAGLALIAFEFATDAWLARRLYGLRGRELFLVEGRHTAAMNSGLAAAALFFWSWALAVRARVSSAAGNIAIAVAIALILLSDSDAVAVGLVAGVVVFGVALALPRAMPWIMAAVIAVGVVAAPLIPGLLPNPLEPGAKIPWPTLSAAHRVVIWNNTVKHIRNNPIVGGGFDTARSLYGSMDKVLYRYPESIIGKPATTLYEPIPLHPHNGVLQVWLELGMVGALILLGLLLAVVRAIATGIEAGADRATALAMLTTMMTIASISFGAWQSWWLTSILLASAFLVAQVTRPGERATPAQPAAVVPNPASRRLAVTHDNRPL